EKQQRSRNDVQQLVEAAYDQGISLLRCRPGSCCASSWFLQCAGLPPRPRNFHRLPHFQRHRRKLSPSPAHPKAGKLLRLLAHQSPEIGAVNSPRSAAKRPINSSSSSAPEGQRQRILTSTARERLLALGRRNACDA